jgi:hypothetical protein
MSAAMALYLSRELVQQLDQQRDLASEPIGDVRVLINDMAPGQVEVTYGGPEGVG